MTREDFYDRFAEKYHLTREQAKRLCRSVFDMMHECILSEDRLIIKGLGTFITKHMPERKVYCSLPGLQNGETKSPAKDKIVFKIYTKSEKKDDDTDEEA